LKQPATKEKLGGRGIGREVMGRDGTFKLRELSTPYKVNLACQNEGLRVENSCSWENTP